MLKVLFHIQVVLLVVLTAIDAYPATIFSDNFDLHAETCHTGGDVPSGWTLWYENDISSIKDSVTHYAGEISIPGRGNTGKSLKVWRHSDWPAMNNYSGGLRYDFSANYSNIFIRYYQKMPTALTLNASDYLKSWRFNTTGGSREIYLDFRQEASGTDMRAEGSWGIYDGGPWVTVLDNNGLRQIWDGNWHCIEFQLGLSNRTLNLWVDGVLIFSDMNRNWVATGYFDFIQHFAIGNSGDGGTWQDSWQAIEFDDLVISTTYVGPGAVVPPSPDPPPSPTTSSSSGGGGCFIATAAFGSPVAPAVRILKEFRNKIMMGSDLGNSFVSYYQRTSPPVADYIRNHDSAKYMVRVCLLPLAGLCWLSLTIGPLNALIFVICIIVLIVRKKSVLNVLRSDM